MYLSSDLVDHGLYRQLSKDFVLDYAKFWDSIIRGNDDEIETAALSLLKHPPLATDMQQNKDSPIQHYRLFASMVSGRSWDAISTKTHGFSNISIPRTANETFNVQSKVGSAPFLKAIAAILSQLPRELLLVMKTNDILRAVDVSLGISDSKHTLFEISRLGFWCTRYVFKYSFDSSSGGNWGYLTSLKYWSFAWRYIQNWSRLVLLGALLRLNS